MPAFLDPLILHVRAGDLATEFPRPYREIATVVIQRDRKAYITGLASEDFHARDAIHSFKAIREMGMRFKWTGIIWERCDEDGNVIDVIELPMVPTYKRAA